MEIQEFLDFAGKYGTGTKVVCEINGEKINDAKLQYENERWYICQNISEGAYCRNKLGYKYSWYCTDGIDSLEEIGFIWLAEPEKFITLPVEKEMRGKFRLCSISKDDSFFDYFGEYKTSNFYKIGKDIGLLAHYSRCFYNNFGTFESFIVLDNGAVFEILELEEAEDYEIKRMYVRLETEEEYAQLIELYDRIGWRWASGDRITDKDFKFYEGVTLRFNEKVTHFKNPDKDRYKIINVFEAEERLKKMYPDKFKAKLNYQVGDRVKVRNLEDLKREYVIDILEQIENNGVYMTRSMQELCGKFVTIASIVRNKFYIIKEDKFSWYDWMLEPPEKEYEMNKQTEYALVLNGQAGECEWKKIEGGMQHRDSLFVNIRTFIKYDCSAGADKKVSELLHNKKSLFHNFKLKMSNLKIRLREKFKKEPFKTLYKLGIVDIDNSLDEEEGILLFLDFLLNQGDTAQKFADYVRPILEEEEKKKK